VLTDLSTNVKLSYVVTDAVVTISTKDDLAKTPIIQVYDIRDLLFSVQNFPGMQITYSNSGGGNGGGGLTVNNSSNNSNNTVNRAQMVRS